MSIRDLAFFATTIFREKFFISVENRLVSFDDIEKWSGKLYAWLFRHVECHSKFTYRISNERVEMALTCFYCHRISSSVFSHNNMLPSLSVVNGFPVSWYLVWFSGFCNLGWSAALKAFELCTKNVFACCLKYRTSISNLITKSHTLKCPINEISYREQIKSECVSCKTVQSSRLWTPQNVHTREPGKQTNVEMQTEQTKTQTSRDPRVHTCASFMKY